MTLSHETTIAAVASAAGGAARGIVRITGPAALDCVAKLFVAEDADESRYDAASVRRGTLTLPDFAAAIPCEAYVWPGERSYTRQPTVELHVPGSPPIVAAALEAACRHGARPAEPGEFTLRAFLAGRLDLTQAEAVLGVVDAEDRRHLDVALRQMAGGLAGPLDRLRNDLLDLTAHLEAGLDFVEEDIEFIARDELLRRLAAVRDGVESVLAQTATRGEAGERPRVVLVGLPNVGKSRLFNALLGREGAIVSPQAGTTRDYVSAVCSFGGVECELIDTAGFETSTGAAVSITAAAQAATGEQARDASIRVLCLDASRPARAWEREQRVQTDPREIIVYTKADLAANTAERGELRVSALSGQGLDALRTSLGAALVELRGGAGDVVAATAVRCRDSLERAAAAVDAARRTAEIRGGDELVALELRTALDELGRVVGAVYTDDILDRIFSRFCIGK
jgi:tRNA modification GTPase